MNSIIKTFAGKVGVPLTLTNQLYGETEKNFVLLQIKPSVFVIKNLSEFIKLDYLGNSYPDLNLSYR